MSWWFEGWEERFLRIFFSYFRDILWVIIFLCFNLCYFYYNFCWVFSLSGEGDFYFCEGLEGF